MGRVAALVSATYKARSAYAHGTEPDNIDLPVLCRLVRACTLARLIVADPRTAGLSLAEVADASLLDHPLVATHVGSSDD